MVHEKHLFMLVTSIFLSLSFTSKIHLPQSDSRISMDSSAFDFWLGKWNATWVDSGKTYHARNTVTRKMNDHFIHESFEILDGPNKGYKGESFSTLDKQSGLWKQTWIDNQGAYLDFTGKEEGDVK